MVTIKMSLKLLNLSMIAIGMSNKNIDKNASNITSTSHGSKARPFI